MGAMKNAAILDVNSVDTSMCDNIAARRLPIKSVDLMFS